MGLLIIYVSLALGVSFLCSIMEAVLLSVSASFAVKLEQERPTLGRKLKKYKTDIDEPLAAILSLNTIAHTVGAAGAGAGAAMGCGGTGSTRPRLLSTTLPGIMLSRSLNSGFVISISTVAGALASIR